MTRALTSRTDIALSILPAITASIAADDDPGEYTCPVSGAVFDILQRDPVDLDEGDTDAFRVSITRPQGHLSYTAETRDDAIKRIADEVAGNLIAVKERLLRACDELGLNKTS